MKSYFVYILKCNDSSYYTGFTNDFERRLNEHSEGLNKDSYTHNKRPITLVWLEIFNDVNDAIATEKRIKGWSRRKREALINQDWENLIQYSKNYTQFGGKIKKLESSTSSD